MSSGAYDPKSSEGEIYAAWEAGGHFHAEPDARRAPYVIVIPPPNVTGALHLGHALNNTLQDILIRRKRMQGFNACWLPGTDHAGIATQAVVERRLREEQGWKRDSANPEHRALLVKKIWEWKDEYNARIVDQLRRMGCSCDWQRTRFTLDAQCAKAVSEMFFRFFRDGLIYRGLRLVNWDPALQTAIADDEIERKTVRTNLWHIRYPILPHGTRDPLAASVIADVTARATAPDAALGRDYLIVATTRPETMLADTAVAVHPDDDRYQALIGQRVLLPLMARAIPVVADGMLVKREFGTGCVKVTPGHDPNDYACWQRKQGQADEIAILDLLTPDGRVRVEFQSAAIPDLGGMKKEDARKRVVAELEKAGLLEKIEPYETEVGHSDRSKAVIEPLRSEQWFVRMDALNGPQLAESAMEAVRDGRIKFFPERYAKTYLDWLGEKRDWCISRQLWWGHRIPVWRHKSTERRAIGVLFGKALSSDALADSETERQLEAFIHRCRDRGDEIQLREFSDGIQWTKVADGVRGGWGSRGLTACLRNPGDRTLIGELEQHGFVQDPDVLDTWFSSALWPHSTFGWPQNAEERAQPSPDREGGVWSDSGSADDSRKPLSHGRGSAGDVSGSPNAISMSDLDYFYPTSVLSTAREIITLWVARMVMTGLYNTGRTTGDGRRAEGRVPFQHVYIHAVIQDGQGRRMSKSAGNGVDPLDIIDAYGADALRFTLAQLATETQDIRIPVKPAQLADGRTVNTSERFELGRNLVTKLWQAATGFVIPTCRDVRIEQNPDRQARDAADLSRINPGSAQPSRDCEQAGTDKGATRARTPLSHGHTSSPTLHTAHRPGEMPLFEKWIRVKLLACIREVDRRLDHYEFSAAVDAIRTFFWNDLCDWYIEEVKSHLRDGGADEHDRNDVKITLLQAFDIVLSLFHPAIPFVTEAIWAEIGREIPRHHELIWPADRQLPDRAPMLIAAPWPKAGRADGRPLAADPAHLIDPDADWLAAVAAQTDAEREVDAFLVVIRALREVRTSLNAIRSQGRQPALRNLPAATVRCEAATAALLRGGMATIARLGQVELAGLTIAPAAAKPPQSMSRVLSVGAVADGRVSTETIEVFVPIAGLADLEVERKRLLHEIEEKAGASQRLTVKLGNEGFVAKAKPEVVEAERTRLGELRETIATLERNLAELQ